MTIKQLYPITISKIFYLLFISQYKRIDIIKILANTKVIESIIENYSFADENSDFV